MLDQEVRLFVCGSMHEGMVHYSKIEKYVIEKAPATAKGLTYRLPVGFHVLVEASDCVENDCMNVEGMLLTVNAPTVLWPILDEFHGVRPMAPEKGLHFKKEISVHTASGAEEGVICYSYNPKKITKDCVLVESGRWQDDYQLNGPVTENLTPRQSQYILKLGQSKGRDIVPIDLSLYRELMNLDIIVDKGRRLALSKLGKDVFKYLS